MANRKLSMNKLRSVLRCHGSDIGAKSISNLTGVARNTVRKYLRRLVELDLDVEELLKLEDPGLNARFGIKTAASENRSERHVELMSLMPDYVRRLRRKGMTRLKLYAGVDTPGMLFPLDIQPSDAAVYRADTSRSPSGAQGRRQDVCRLRGRPSGDSRPRRRRSVAG